MNQGDTNTDRQSTDDGVPVTCACPHGGGHNDYSSQACSWEQWIAGRPPDHPKRLRHEAGDNTLDWEDINYNGEPCHCACHDDEDW